MKRIFFALLYTLVACQGNSNSSARPEKPQPEILSRQAMFDVNQLTFNENAVKLIAPVLDSVNENTGAARQKADYEWKVNMTEGNLVYESVPGKRYYYKSLKTDSLAHYDGLVFNQVELETDENDKLISFVGYSEIETKKELDSLIFHLYDKLGSYEELNYYKYDASPPQKVNYLSYNEVKKYSKHYVDTIKKIRSDIYDYDTQNTSFDLWKFDDRIIQLKIEPSSEAGFDTEKGAYHRDYFSIQFLVLKRSEYDQIEAQQLTRLKQEKKYVWVLKPYIISTMSYREGDGRYLTIMSDLLENIQKQ
ncbi:hypothetical protein ACR79S_10035 [Sphingobacterium spiritivorum]|uniref:hypothetical protein n=1 Tax=Sphingobacterium spiritivorum TaxID=258 RepID=UPI003DA4D604